MKRMIVKRLALILALAMLIMVMAACKGGEPEEEPTPDPTPSAELIVMDALPVHSDTWEDILNEEVEPPTPTPSVVSSTSGRDRSAAAPYQPSFVCFDNAPDNWPLSGILEADIVYEAPAAAGSGNTRLLALFSDAYPAQTGPVGMAYSDFFELQNEWGGMFVHHGYPTDSGYPQMPTDGAGQRVTNEGDAKTHFFTPENASGLFVHLDQLVAALYSKKAAEEDVRFLLAEGYTYEKAESAVKVKLPFGGGKSEAVEYVFDPEAGMYLRYQAGADGRMTGLNALSWNEEGEALESVPLYVNNIIVQYVAVGDAGMTLIGTGACEFFVNGLRIVGTWSRETADAPTYYYLENGNVVTLETGRTWIALHPADATIEVTK